MISPDQAIVHLKKISSYLDSTDRPDRSLVQLKIGQIINSLNAEEVSPWDYEQGERTKERFEDSTKENDPGKLQLELRAVKREIDRFIKILQEEDGDFSEDYSGSFHEKKSILE